MTTPLPAIFEKALRRGLSYRLGDREGSRACLVPVARPRRRRDELNDATRLYRYLLRHGSSKSHNSKS